jgi:hypothetical protein
MKRDCKKSGHTLCDGINHFDGIRSSVICDEIQNIDRQQTAQKQKDHASGAKVVPSSKMTVANKHEGRNKDASRGVGLATEPRLFDGGLFRG